jgi:hypothetical protein
MIPKEDIKKIDESDLKLLIENEIPEDMTQEYKREFPLTTQENKIKFLASVSSFANTSGGDLIIGIEVDNESKLPKKLVGIPVSNNSTDEPIRGMDDLIRQGIQPRILEYQIHPIKLENSNFAFLIRIKKSWINPHRVTLSGHDRFYIRGAASTNQMDVTQLRSAFLLSETRIEKIKLFISERISNIYSNEIPTLLPEGAKVILHIIPLASFDPEHVISIHENEKTINQLLTLRCGPTPLEYNLDGILMTNRRDRDNLSSEYIQFFRQGIIESVSGNYLVSYEDKCIPIYLFEKNLIQALENNLDILKLLRVEPPILIKISLTHIKNYKRCKSQHEFENPREIFKDILQLPETIIDNYKLTSDQILHNAFDALSNACGLPKSPNYDDNGRWAKNR